MSRAKRHHQVPQFYLRSFADPKGRVRVYDRITGIAFNQLVANIAVESNLYTVRDESGEPSDEVEKEFAKFEALVVKPLQRLLAPEPTVSTVDHEIVAHFVAMQFLRTTAARDQLEDVNDLLIRLDVEANIGGDPPESVDRFIQKRFGDRSKERQQEIRAVAADLSRPVRLSNEDWLHVSLPLIPDLAKLLLARDWWLAESHERAFLTCDNPVVLIAGDGALNSGVGILTANAILLPLSPYRTLIMEGQDTGGALTLITASRDLIRWVNLSVANRATRQIFFHPKANPMVGIQIPPQPLSHLVNGIIVGRRERSYDKIREQYIPHLHRMREKIRTERGRSGTAIRKSGEP